MGLSYAPDYTWTEHFEARALERFGVTREDLSRWVGRQRNSLTAYADESDQGPESKKYVSDDGIIFVCNTIELTFVTCYEANDLLEDGQKVTIHEQNLDLFSEEVRKLAHKYRLKDAQEMLLSVEEHLEAFQVLSQKIMKGRLTEKNYLLIDQLMDEYHIVKAALRVIETKRKDFKNS